MMAKRLEPDSKSQLAAALWRIYRRPERPLPWVYGGNLPWDEPEFSERMLREHLDQSHGAASRTAAERQMQIDWLWSRLGLAPDCEVLDLTCGPGLFAVELARRGCRVTGIDFAPAAIRYARSLAEEAGVAGRCRFEQRDVLSWEPAAEGSCDAAILLYGQLAVMPREAARRLLAQIAAALRPGGRLLIEILNQARVDKGRSSWWYTDESGLWGEAPYLHLGERQWLADERMSLERFFILHLESGRFDEITLCDQTYRRGEMVEMLAAAGFARSDLYPRSAGLPLADREEWDVYIAWK